MALSREELANLSGEVPNRVVAKVERRVAGVIPENRMDLLVGYCVLSLCGFTTNHFDKLIAHVDKVRTHGSRRQQKNEGPGLSKPRPSIVRRKGLKSAYLTDNV